MIGNSGVAVAWALHYYLRTFTNSHFAWDAVAVRLPTPLAPVNADGAALELRANDRCTLSASTQHFVQYIMYMCCLVSTKCYQNVCSFERSFVHAPNVVTFGYTTQWWEWPRLEQFVDWLALHGVNLPLLPLAHEAVLTRVRLSSTHTFSFTLFALQPQHRKCEQHFDKSPHVLSALFGVWAQQRRDGRVLHWTRVFALVHTWFCFDFGYRSTLRLNWITLSHSYYSNGTHVKQKKKLSRSMQILIGAQEPHGKHRRVGRAAASHVDRRAARSLPAGAAEHARARHAGRAAGLRGLCAACHLAVCSKRASSLSVFPLFQIP